MITLMLLAVLVATPATDPCGAATAEGASPVDPTAASIYRAVAEDELARGNLVAARIAFRRALLLDPSDPTRVRARLEMLCRPLALATTKPPVARSQPFDEGLRRMEQGDRTGAIQAFQAARASGPEPAAALLEGICSYELGDDRRARPLFEEARRAPATAGTALFFLGLIALHDDQTVLASSLLTAAAARDVTVAAAASGLARLAERDGRIVLSALAETGFDSNVELTPDNTATTAGSGDGYATGVVGAFWRPMGRAGPYVRATAQYREQARLHGYDLAELGGALGWRAMHRQSSAALEYAYDFVTLGGSAYLSAHRWLATGRLVLDPLAFAATYAGRLESFLGAATADYSGVRHEGEMSMDWQAGAATAIGLGYHLGKDSARDTALGYFEHGPFAFFRLGLGSLARLFASGRFTARRYAAVDPDLAIERTDRYLDATIGGELDVATHLAVRVTATARRALSDVTDFQYAKFTAALGLVYARGFDR